MGALDEGHLDLELENGVKQGSIDLGVEEEPEILAIEDAVKVLLQGLGEDVNREGLRKTPLRVAKAFREGTRGYRKKVKDIVQGALFPEAGLDCGLGQAGGAGGLVIVRNIDLFSYCESCLLPFQVKCHVGYVPAGHRVLGLSKLSRVADVFAKRLQEPHRLANEICSALQEGIKPAGVAVVLQCSHIRFPTLESVRLDSNPNGWVKVSVISGAGVFENKRADVWNDFSNLLRFKGINVEKSRTEELFDQIWCPSSAKMSSVFGLANPEMITAVTSMVRLLGEDPSRKELVGTPTRFVKWLMNFRNYNLEMNLNRRIDLFRSNGEVSCDVERMSSEFSLPFWSQCEHHLLPFHGVVHIGYFCSKELLPVAKSVLQSIVHFHGFKLQVQERLTRQIAETVSSLLGEDVMVAVEAYHTCMISRGIEKFGSSTATIAVLGRFSTDPTARTMFMQHVPNSISELYIRMKMA